MPSGTHPTYMHCYKVHMLGLPTWEGGIFICKSISGAHDDMTYFTFYRQSPEHWAQCIASEVKALPPVEKSSSRDPDKGPPHGGREARSSIKWHRVSAKTNSALRQKVIRHLEDLLGTSWHWSQRKSTQGWKLESAKYCSSSSGAAGGTLLQAELEEDMWTRELKQGWA